MAAVERVLFSGHQVKRLCWIGDEKLDTKLRYFKKEFSDETAYL
jgi:hypothetical protein